MLEVSVSAILHKDETSTGQEGYGVIGRSGLDILYNTKRSLSAAPMLLSPAAQLWLASVSYTKLKPTASYRYATQQKALDPGGLDEARGERTCYRPMKDDSQLIY